MARQDIGPKIGIQGESEFRRELRSINEGLKTLGSEMAVVTSEFIGNESSVEALTAKNDVLGRTALSLIEKLEKQREMLLACAQAFGEADPRTQKWQQTVNATAAELNRTQAQIEQNTEAIENFGESESAASEKTSLLGAVAGELGLSAQMLTLAGAVGVAAAAIKGLIGFFSDAARAGASYADEILTQSTNYSISAQKLQEYRYMSELADTSVETITGALGRLTRSMDEARNGTGDAAEAFRFLNIRVTDANGELRSAEDVFEQAIGSLGYVENAAERDAIAMTLFGKSAQELNSLIALGSDGFAAYAAEAEKLSYILSDEELALLGQVDDNFQRLDKSMEAAKNRIAVELAPALIELTNTLLNIIQNIDWESFGKSASYVLEGVNRLLVQNSDTLIALADVIINVTGAVGGLLDKFAELTQYIGGGSSGRSLFGNLFSGTDNMQLSTPASRAASIYSSTGGRGYGSSTVQLTGDVYLNDRKVGNAMYSGLQQADQRHGLSAVDRAARR